MNDHWPTLQTKINITIMGLLSILFFVPAFSADNIETIESVTIIGSVEDLRKLPGSGQVIPNEDLLKAMDTDIQKILTAVPGVYMRTEEGYGLRPNISIRGTAIERSGKVTIMEDGVLVSESDLDIFHGHNHVTSDYPDGIYHYHITDVDPYINGDGFRGTPGTVTR